MDRRSRDYALKTSSLAVVHSHRIFRAVWVVLGFLKNLIRSTELAAQLFRSWINHFEGFICQHLVWTLQLLGKVDIETDVVWADVRRYCSPRNTLGFFRR